ncbi:hypothetical protein ACWD4O_12355 [Streptomyces sp. NPDC002623]
MSDSIKVCPASIETTCAAPWSVAFVAEPAVLLPEATGDWAA